MLIVGLTGSIASGKSTASARLKEHYKIPVIDADLIAKQIVEPGKPAYNDIKEYFGKFSDNILLASGDLDRQELGRLVFGEANKHHLQKLNSFTHPRVGLEMVKQVGTYYVQGYDLVILDVPLLFEAKFNYYCGIIINITCPKDIQLARLLARNPHLSEDEARKRIDSQWSMELKSKCSDYVVDNSGSVEELFEKLDKVVADIKPNYYWNLFQLVAAPVGLSVGALRYAQNIFKYRQN